MSGYQHITILECNRASSEEGKSGNESNPALYQNKLGTGVKLDIGDTLSVERAFISEIGSGGNTMEFSSKRLGASYDLIKTSVTEFGSKTDGTESMNKYPVCIVANASLVDDNDKPIEITDNVAYLQHSYYKTANGEFTIAMPRSYIPISCDVDAIRAAATATGGVYWNNGEGGALNLSEPWKFNEMIDANYKTRKWYNDSLSCWNMRETCMNGAPQAWTSVGQRVVSDYYRRDGTENFLGPRGASQFKFLDGTTVREGYPPFGEWEDGSAWKLKNDNSRYTIFRRAVNYRNYDSDQFVADATWGMTLTPGGESEFTGSYLTRERINAYMYNGYQERWDYSVRDYVEVKNVVKLEVPEGYNSPENVADQITTQLNDSGNVEKVSSGQQLSGDGEKQGPIGATFKQEGTVYDPFPCVSGINFNESNWNAWYEAPKEEVSVVVDTGIQDATLPQQVEYLNSFETIAVKRADLWTLGREAFPPTTFISASNVSVPTYAVETGTWNDNLGSTSKFTVRNPIGWLPTAQGTFTSTDLPYFQSGIAYTPENCLKIKKLFKAQKKYPELFYINGEDNGYIGPSYDNSGAAQATWKTDYWSKYDIRTSRFLHMNGEDMKARTDTPNYAWLGSDNLWDETILPNWRGDAGNVTAGAKTSAWTGDPETPWRDDDYGPVNPELATFEASLPAPVGTSWGPDITDNTLYKTGDEYNWASYPVFLYFDETREDAYSASGGTIGTNKHLCYGCMQSSNGLDDGTGFIIFTQQGLHDLISPWLFNYDTDGGVTVDEINSKVGGDLDNFRCFGWDAHFNAYSTAVILPFNGIAPTNCPNSSKNLPVQSEVEGVRLGKLKINEGKPDAATMYMDIHGPKWYAMYPTTGIYIQPAKGFGYTPTGEIRNSVDKSMGGTVLGNSINYGFYNQLYIGALNPQLIFDGESSRFLFSGLHTPEFTGDDFQAGKDQENPMISDADTPVYHINKVLKNTNWCVDMMPYDHWTSKEDSTGSDSDKKYKQFYYDNPNMSAEAVFDAMSGIMIRDFGIPENLWSKSIWGLLGFSYRQFHRDDTELVYISAEKGYGLKNDQYRETNIANFNMQDSFTTNALVEVKDQPNWSKNYWGADMLLPDISHQKSTLSTLPEQGDRFQPTSDANFQKYLRQVPTIVVDSVSTHIEAEGLPIKMVRPYFTIRSDIIQDPSWLGGADSGQIMPIVSVVSKQNADGDFFFQENPSDLVFTNTIPRTLTDVKISIHDPSGQFARVDESSCVLFKIIKQVSADMNVVGSILQGMSKKKQEQEMINLGISPPQKIIL